MDRPKKPLHYNVTGTECRRDTRGLAGHPQVAVEVLEGYLSSWEDPPEKMGSKPQAGLNSL